MEPYIFRLISSINSTQLISIVNKTAVPETVSFCLMQKINPLKENAYSFLLQIF